MYYKWEEGNKIKQAHKENTIGGQSTALKKWAN